MPQTFLFAISPAQRFNLHALMLRAQDKIADAQTGKAFRRTFRALGLEPIFRKLREGGGKAGVSTMLANDDGPKVHELPLEAVGYMVKHVLTLPDKPPLAEILLGDFFDDLEIVNASKDTDAIMTERATRLLAFKAYVATAEDWTPEPPRLPSPGDLVCPNCGHAFPIDDAPDEGAALRS